MLAAAFWGAALGALPGAQFTMVLLGPPVAYLLLRKRPLLSWQIPILAAAISIAVKERDPQGPYTEGSVLPIILLIWVVGSVFSVPWPYLFQRRMQRDRETATTLVEAAKMSFGVGFLVFLACGLIILGFAFCAMGVAEPSSRESVFGESAPFLMVTIGIGLAVYICRNAKSLCLNKEVESIFGWILAFVALTVVPMVSIDLYRGRVRCAPSSPDCTQLAPPLELFLDCAASLEAVVTVIWLLWRGKRSRRVEESAFTRGGA